MASSVARLPNGSIPSGFACVDMDHVKVTSGDITLNATAITELTAFRLTLTAKAGDVLCVLPCFDVSNSARVVGFDSYTMTSGFAGRTNPVGAGLSASLASTGGVTGWLCPSIAQDYTVGPECRYVLQAGDIVSNQVLVSFHYAKADTTARTLYANTNSPAWMAASVYRVV